jgi:hypothetical protein
VPSSLDFTFRRFDVFGYFGEPGDDLFEFPGPGERAAEAFTAYAEGR